MKYEHLSFRLTDTPRDKAIKAKLRFLKKAYKKSYNELLKESVEKLCLTRS